MARSSASVSCPGLGTLTLDLLDQRRLRGEVLGAVSLFSRRPEHRAVQVVEQRRVRSPPAGRGRGPRRQDQVTVRREGAVWLPGICPQAGCCHDFTPAMEKVWGQRPWP